MVQISQIPAWFKYVRFRVTLSVAPYGVAASNPKDLGMVAPLSEFCHRQAALEAATQNSTMPKKELALGVVWCRIVVIRGVAQFG